MTFMQAQAHRIAPVGSCDPPSASGKRCDPGNPSKASKASPQQTMIKPAYLFSEPWRAWIKRWLLVRKSSGCSEVRARRRSALPPTARKATAAAIALDWLLAASSSSANSSGSSSDSTCKATRKY